MSVFSPPLTPPHHQAFLSHSGENKFTVAKPLVDILRKHGITVYFDHDSNIAGSTFDALNHAMQTATVGIFVLSPEFVRRKVPMKELLTFVRRVRNHTEPVPKLIGIYYNLSIAECRSGSIVDALADDPGSAGFMGQASAADATYHEDVKDALKFLSFQWGYENLERASNDRNPVIEESTRRFITRISDDILHKVVPIVGPLQKLKTFCQMAPSPQRNLYLNFDDKSTPEGRLYDAILCRSGGNSGNATAVGVVADSVRSAQSPIARGPGGVGKTQTVCHIAHMEEVKQLFPDGVLFTELGEQARLESISSGIVSMLEKVGATEECKRIRLLQELGQVVREAAIVFKPLRCLIIFDDVWQVNDIPMNIIHKLVQLVHGSGCKIVYTSRDKKLYGADPIIFKERSNEVAKKMLLMQSELDVPTSKIGKCAFQAVLDFCKGLPIALAMAGQAIKNLAIEKEGAAKEHAWVEYNAFHVDRDPNTDHMKQVLIKSVHVLVRENPRIDFWDYFSRLCVIRKAQSVPLSVVGRMWATAEADTESLVLMLERYTIVRLNTENLSEQEAQVSLHDLILDLSQGEAKKTGITEQCCLRVIASYRPRRV